MFDPKPSTCLPNWSENGTDITVPIATFPELTSAEADATTGDIRKVMFAILEKVHTHFAALDPADRPQRMVIAKTVNVNPDTGIVTNVYQFTFTNEIVSQEVEDEPS